MKFHLKKGRKRLCLQQERRECYSWGTRGSECPALPTPQYSPLPTQGVAPQDSVRDAGKPKLFANKRPQPPSGMYTQGPGKEGTLGPARDKREGHRCGRQPDLHVPGRAGTQARLRASRLPGGSGPSRPPHAFSLPGTHGERAEAPELRSARGGRSGWTLRPPGPRADAGTLGGASRRAQDRGAPHSPLLHGPGVVTQPRASSSSAGLRRKASQS